MISVFARIEFKFFVLFAFLFLLGWPFLAGAGDRSFLFYFVYYFSVWLALELFLILESVEKNEKNKND